MSRFVVAIFFALVCVLGVPDDSFAADYAFPVIGPATFSNDFNAPRASGPHHATDIFADKHRPVVSRTDGTISFVGYPQPSWGFAVAVDAPNGYRYWYIHLNNDNPGTDDGGGGGMHAYGPDIVYGKSIVQGQLIGYVGDSGNAENTPPHLHFEAYDGNQAKNPYHGLVNNSYQVSKPIRNYPVDENEFLPVYAGFDGEANIAIGDIDNDSVDEVVTGSGPGGKFVKIFEVDGTFVSRFMPNNDSFVGGIDVAVADTDNDGVDEIVTASGPEGKYVKIFESDGTLLNHFSPDSSYDGGMNIELGDVDDDGQEEIITATEAGRGYVRVFETDGTQVSEFHPYGSSYTRGVNLAVGDISGDSAEEIITGAKKGGGPRVSIFDSAGNSIDTYYAYGSAFKGGIRVATANIDTGTPKNEVVTIPENDGSARVKMFSPTGGYLDYSSYFAELWWKGHYDLAATDEQVLVSLGINRRVSVRSVTNLSAPD